jgi:hypothetical protein
MTKDLTLYLHKIYENEYLALQRNYKYIFLNGDFNSRTAKDPDFIYIENNNDNKTISSKSSVFDSTKQRISNVLTNS